MSAEPTAVLSSLAGHAIPLKNVSIAGVADGCLFEATVEQRYTNAEPTAIEAVYTFPLPIRAVLLDFELEIGERRLRGVVERRREASERYETALESGHGAALLERSSDGLYAVGVGNLLPGETATVRFRYAELLDIEHGRIRLAIPTVLAPRYGHASSVLEPHLVPGVDLTASYPCTFSLELRGALTKARAESPTWALVNASDGDTVTYVAAPGFRLDRDLVVLIEGLSSSSHSVMARDGDDYVALASVTVPPLATGRRSPRALKLVVDCSGSMAGDSIQQAREALLAALASLSPADTVSLTRFGTQPQTVTRGLEPASAATLLRLDAIVRRMQADLGGTEMQAAVDATFVLPVPQGQAADLLLITDGEIWALDPLLARVSATNHRLFVLAVGSSPNEELARRIAVVTRGACEFVTPHEDMRAAVARLMARMDAPVLTIDAVQWGTAPKLVVGLGQVVFPGDTAHVFAWFESCPTGMAVVEIVGSPEPMSARSGPLGPIRLDTTLARMAASRRLSRLDDESAAVLAERYQLVTDLTSCVVVAERDSREAASGQPALRPVPHMLAAGYGALGRLLLMRAGALTAGGQPPVPMAVPLGDRSPSMRSTTFGARGAPSLPAPSQLHDAMHNLADGLPASAGAEEFAAALSAWIREKGALPASVHELEALGVGDIVCEALRTIVQEGRREPDVVAAWLAVFAKTHPTLLDDAIRRRISRAASWRMRRAVGRRLPAAMHP